MLTLLCVSDVGNFSTPLTLPMRPHHRLRNLAAHTRPRRPGRPLTHARGPLDKQYPNDLPFCNSWHVDGATPREFTCSIQHTSFHSEIHFCAVACARASSWHVPLNKSANRSKSTCKNNCSTTAVSAASGNTCQRRLRATR